MFTVEFSHNSRTAKSIRYYAFRAILLGIVVDWSVLDFFKFHNWDKYALIRAACQHEKKSALRWKKILYSIKKYGLIISVMRKYISWENAETFAPDRVKVYRNLTYKCWTICDAKDGKLYCHADSIDLRNCKFRVQPAGRARVLKEKQKNVHAYVVGKFHDINFDKAQYFPYGYKFAQAFYNPYKVETFVDFHSGEELKEAARVVCKKAPDGEMNIYYANPFKAMKDNKVYAWRESPFHIYSSAVKGRESLILCQYQNITYGRALKRAEQK